MKDPAVLLYTQDFLVGTMTMTDAQVGQYIRLLCVQHQKGPLSIDEMNAVVHGTVDAVVLSKFDQNEQGLYFNARMYAEAKKRQAFTESRRANAKHKPEHMLEHKPEHMAKHMENENEDENTNTNKKILQLHLDIAHWFLAERQKLNPDCKTPNIQKWANTFRLMIDYDKLTPERIKAVALAGFRDDFWGGKGVLQSPDGLRKHWDKISEKVKPTKKTPMEFKPNVFPVITREEQARMNAAREAMLKEVEKQIGKSTAAKQKQAEKKARLFTDEEITHILGDESLKAMFIKKYPDQYKLYQERKQK